MNRSQAIMHCAQFRTGTSNIAASADLCNLLLSASVPTVGSAPPAGLATFERMWACKVG